MIANTPQPPYYAVIFTSERTDEDSGYAEMAQKMLELAQKQPGILDVESAREELGITVSYWRNLDSIKHWKNNVDHIQAREKGRNTWYRKFKTRIALVESDYHFHNI